MIKHCSVILLFLILSATTVFAENPIKVIFEQATISYQKGDYQKAIDLYEKTLDLYPDFAPSYNFLGLCHKAIGSDAEGIIWLFKRAIELDPTYEMAYENLAKTYYSLGRYTDAEDSALKALELAPDNPNVKLVLGWIYLLGKSEATDAVYYFEEVLKDNKDVPYLYFGLGLGYFMKGENFRALEMITQLKQMNQTGMAKQLEQIVRHGSYKPPDQPGSPLYIPDKQPGILVGDEIFLNMGEKAASAPTNAPAKGYPVRLRGKMPRRSFGDEGYGSQRIQALQKRIRDAETQNTPSANPSQ